jgi:hypothetical protein
MKVKERQLMNTFIHLLATLNAMVLIVKPETFAGAKILGVCVLGLVVVSLTVRSIVRTYAQTSRRGE